MKVTLLLADYAVVAENKLTVVGGGWSLIGPGPTPQAVAIKLEVPWHQAFDQHEIKLELVDADGQPVLTQTPMGMQPIVMNGQFQAQGDSVDPAVKPGTPIDVMFALNAGPLPLAGGQRFEWRLTVDGEGQEDWHVGFSTRPMQLADQDEEAV